MTNSKHLERIDWFLPLRLASYVILFAAIVLWMDFPGFMQVPVIIYSLLTLAVGVSLTKKFKRKLAMITPWIVALHFVFEIALESIVVYSTGDISSPLTAMFVLTIASAALVYRLAGTLLMATIVSSALSIIVWFVYIIDAHLSLSIDELSRFFVGKERMFYAIFFHFLIFYLVAFISGYLAERIKSGARQLEDTSRALRIAKLETDDILRHLSSGLMSIDARGVIIFFNRAAETITGFNEKDIRGKDCHTVFHKRMPELARCLKAGIDERMEFPRKELQIEVSPGNVIPLGLSTSVLTEPDGELRGLIVIFSDLTEAKELEDKVRSADRLSAIGELSACIAHEIRNPLAAISGSVEVIKNELSLEGSNQKLMDLIIKESDRLTKMLTKFLQYASIERRTFNKVELCHLISETMEILYRDESIHSNIKVNLESEESIVYVIGDEDLIKQILINLAVNACQAFEGQPGEIIFKVSIDAEQQIVRLEVIDNGPGMSAELTNKAFQPFFSTRKGGTGLGLAIVHRLAEVLGIDIRIESEENVGTSFILEFKTYSQPGLADLARQTGKIPAI
ncbi:MAG: PAS domain S-box protein [candidate division Zixibacteria bacterium]|nr:PAS domain S-box protein [candidate division Zixibacteria bacterium]